MKIENLRIGHGYDIHAFDINRKLILGTIDIPHTKGLLGHSDADCLLHALSDALLGAAGLPDIGYYFPNTDKSIQGISSKLILKKVMEELSGKKYRLINTDISIIAEEPKLKPYIPQMKVELSKLLHITIDCIGIKATTNEKLGSLGRAEGIAVHAVVLIAK